MNTCRQARGRGREIRAFTLIELLTVIGIIVLVLALALPNFVSMMKGRKWEAAISSIQTMVMRARALATNVRKDFSVEFLIDPDNGTTMWLESEVNAIERIPDLIELQRMVGGWGAISDFIQTFVASGGSYDTWYYESRCRVLSCGHKWSSYSEAAAKTCPKCGATGWEFGPEYIQMYYNITYDSSRSKTTEYGDNARQSEWVPLPRRITIDLARSVNFISWDDPDTVEAYGSDEYPDIRIGTNGALVQSVEPLLCLMDTDADERRGVTVVRCTGRLVPARLP